MARNNTNKDTGSHLGFEATLWATADKLRGNLDAAEYKHVVLGLIFLKYISDAFAEKHAELQKEKGFLAVFSGYWGGIQAREAESARTGSRLGIESEPKFAPQPIPC